MTQQQTQSPAEVYESFLGPSLFSPWARLLIERAAPAPGERVLDLACGTGIVTRQVAPLVGNAGHVVGVDLSGDMLAVARTRPAPDGASIEWQQCDACALDVPAGSFDLVLCQQGLQFFPDQAAAVRGVHRALAPGGRAVVAVWQSLERHAVLHALFAAESQHLQLPLEQVATPFSLHDESVLRALLQDGGFREVEVEPASLEARFPSADRWVELTVRAGAAVMPHLAKDGDAMTELLRHVQQESAPVVDRHRDGEALRFPMYSHVAVARK